MDNLTHSLIGAALGQAGLKRRTGLAMPALIIAANLPDVDAGCVVFGIESLSMRRGLSHGPLALAVLPLLLAGGLWWFDRWQARRGKRPEGRLPVHFGWLLALCWLGALTHPLFDWFNNYGIRLLEPFSHRWFYGDTLFIIDPWIIAMLGAGVWFSLRRERAGKLRWANPARVGALGVALFIALNAYISTQAKMSVDAAFQAFSPTSSAELYVANALPLVFWKRQVIWRDGETFGQASYNALEGSPTIETMPLLTECAAWQTCDAKMVKFAYTNMSDPRIAEWAKHDPAAQAFLFWSRMPVAELHPDYIVLRDQRFMDPRTARQFSVTLRPPQK